LLYPLGDVGSLTRITNQLLREPERMAAMSAAAKQRIAEHFSLSQMISKHEELYESLYRSKTKRASKRQ
jgi:glycosyltransferase involved in cell wall biosynthesis